MFNLFEIQTPLVEKTLKSIEDPLRKVLISINDNTGNYPFVVTTENLAMNNVQGKNSYLFHEKVQAEEKFSSLIQQYKSSGYAMY